MDMKGLGSALPNRKDGGKKSAKPADDDEDDDDEEFDVSQLAAGDKEKLLAALRSGGNPDLIKALQGRLDGLVGRNSGYIDSLPSKARVALFCAATARVRTHVGARRARRCRMPRARATGEARARPLAALYTRACARARAGWRSRAAAADPKTRERAFAAAGFYGSL